MARTGQLIINPGADTAPGAEWVAVTNVLTRGFGSFAYTEPTFRNANSGAFDFHQDVAVPAGQWAAVDASQYIVDYDAVGAKTSTGITFTMELIALDGASTVLQTWSQVVSVSGKPYTQFTVRQRILPPGTRTIRVRFWGNDTWVGAWWEVLGLYLENIGAVASKYNMYGILGPRPGASATKYIMYAVLGPPPPAIPTEGGGPTIEPPDDCQENGNPNCCVPDLNRVIEARVGPLNTHNDIVVAIQYLQDRHNVLVREFNKLATVTRPNPPSV